MNRRPNPWVDGPRKCRAFRPQSLGRGRSSPVPRKDSCPKPVLDAVPWLTTPTLGQSGTELPSGSCPEDQALEARARSEWPGWKRGRPSRPGPCDPSLTAQGGCV